MDKEQQTKKHRLVNRSKITKFFVISFFIIFAVIAFYFSFNKAIDVPDINSKIQEITNDDFKEFNHDESFFQGYYNSGIKLDKNRVVKEEFDNKKWWRQWSVFITDFLLGQEVMQQLVLLSDNTNNHDLKVDLENLYKLLKSLKGFNIYDLSQEAMSVNQTAIENRVSYSYQGPWKNFVSRNLKVLKKQQDSEILKEVLYISHCIGNYNFTQAIKSYVECQNKCDNCLDSGYLNKLKKWREVFAIIHKINLS